MSANDTNQSRGASDTLTIDVEWMPNGTLVRLSGACTMDVSERLRRSLLPLASDPEPLIVIDLSSLDFIESTGLGAIVSVYLRCHRLKGEIRFLSPKEHVRHILTVTRLTQIIPVFERLEDALKRP